MAVDVMSSSGKTSAMARISAMSTSRPCRMPAFTTRRRSSCRNVVGHQLRHRGPLASREGHPKALVRSACRVFQPRRRSMQLLKTSQRGVDVCLVEDFAAVDQIAFDCQNIDPRHSASKPSCEVPCPPRDDRSAVAQPMHGLDVDAALGGSCDARRYAAASPGANAIPDDGRYLPSPALSRGVRAG